MIFDGNLDILLFVVMGLWILFKPFNSNTALSGKGEGTSLLLPGGGSHCSYSASFDTWRGWDFSLLLEG